MASSFTVALEIDVKFFSESNHIVTRDCYIRCITNEFSMRGKPFSITGNILIWTFRAIIIWTLHIFPV